MADVAFICHVSNSDWLPGDNHAISEFDGRWMELIATDCKVKELIAKVRKIAFTSVRLIMQFTLGKIKKSTPCFA